jgi:hypothetical protein
LYVESLAYTMGPGPTASPKTVPNPAVNPGPSIYELEPLPANVLASPL